MSATSRGLLAVGKVVKAFGIRGELVILPMTDEPERFRRLKTLLLGTDEETAENRSVERAVVEHRGVRIKLEGVDDRTAAEGLVGSLLFVNPRQRIRLAQGKHFVHDVIGLAVVDEEKGPIGVVRDVMKYPAHDVYVVEHNGREFMIPAVKEFIRAIDPQAGRMTVRLISGLMDEENSA